MHVARYKPVQVRPYTGLPQDAGCLEGSKVAALCAIGTPESFVSTLEEAGARVVVREFHPDHHPFFQDDLDGAERRRQEHGADWIETTEKDAVRMSALCVPEALRVLSVDMEISDLDRLVALCVGEDRKS